MLKFDYSSAAANGIRWRQVVIVRNAVDAHNLKNGGGAQQSLFRKGDRAGYGNRTAQPSFGPQRPPQEKTQAQHDSTVGHRFGSSASSGTLPKRRVVNKVMLEGRLGHDPELKHTPGGRPYVKFPVATQRSYKDGSGEWQKRTQWHRVQVWGEVAEIVVKYLRKGSHVHIEGKLSTSEWIDSQNNKRTTTEVVATGFRFLDGLEPSSNDNSQSRAMREACLSPSAALN
jgi:single-strand DNA-binding protein